MKLGVFEEENNWLTAYYCKEMCFSLNIMTSIMLQSISVCPEWCQWCSVPLCLSFEHSPEPILFILWIIRVFLDFCFKSGWELQVFTAKHFD